MHIAYFSYEYVCRDIWLTINIIFIKNINSTIILLQEHESKVVYNSEVSRIFIHLMI